MPSRNYSDTVPQTTLQGNATGFGGVSSSDTNFVLGASLSSYISNFPFVLRIEPGTVNEEEVLVTSGAGTVGSPYVVTRGFGSAVAFAARLAISHPQGVVVSHGVGAADFTDLRDVVDTSGSYASRTSQVVVSASTTETVLQAITAKTIDAAIGNYFKLSAWGTFDNVVTAIPTITFRVRIGGLAGTTMATIVLQTPATALSASPWSVDTEVVLQANLGVSALWKVKLAGGFNVSATSGLGTDELIIPNATTAASSLVDQAIVITAQWSSATAGNALRCDSGIGVRLT